MSENNKDALLYDKYNSARNKIIASIGIIVTIIAIVLIFFISSLEGTSEIQASNYKSGKILNVWRNNNDITDENERPIPKATIVEYDGRDYYYIEEYNNMGDVTEWYFAFEGGLGYVFNDYKYYVLTALVSVIAIFVSWMNYTTAVNNGKQTEKFEGALSYYGDAKKKVRGYFHLIPKFCSNKTTEARKNKERTIVEEAGLLYEDYINQKVDYSILDKWQTKILKKIKKIRVKPLTSTELLSDQSTAKGEKVRLLPPNEKENERHFLVFGSIQKVISVALGGVTVAFGIVLGNWGLGATYGVTVLIGAVSATIAGNDYAFSTLRGRIISKGDYLIEFDGVKEEYVLEEEKNKQEKLDKPDNSIDEQIPKEGEEDGIR